MVFWPSRLYSSTPRLEERKLFSGEGRKRDRDRDREREKDKSGNFLFFSPYLVWNFIGKVYIHGIIFEYIYTHGDGINFELNRRI